MTKPVLADSFGRHFPYLRLSVTDVCNFRCSYCLPNGYKQSGCNHFLTSKEIVRLVKSFVSLGIWKIRLTGGEPTLRPDFIEIAERISTIPGVKYLAFTTNGYKLHQNAQLYYNAGLHHINISIDSLDTVKFKNITGHDRLEEILESINICRKIGFKTIKINTVLLKGFNDAELDNFIQFVLNKPITLRFIELMRTGDNHSYFSRHHLSGNEVIQRLQSLGWRIKPQREGAGPAQEFIHTFSKGSIGIIAPYSKDFCQTCNRLRTSARGELHLCLFGSKGYSLRSLLQSDDQQDQLKIKIVSLMKQKKIAHSLHDNNSGIRDHLASIGG